MLATVDAPQLGLRANWRQFTLLVVVNAFVGAMVGLERTVLPLLARKEFGVATAAATLSAVASSHAPKLAISRSSTSTMFIKTPPR